MFQIALQFRHIILETLVDGTTVLIYWRVEGTHKKELLGCAPTNKAIVYTGMSLFYFDEQNLISKVVTCFDEKSFIEQLRDSSEPEWFAFVKTLRPQGLVTAKLTFYC